MSSIKPNIITYCYHSLTNGIKNQKTSKKFNYQNKGEIIQKLTEFNNDINLSFKTSTFNNLNIESAMLRKNNILPTESTISLLRSNVTKIRNIKIKTKLTRT